MKIPRKMKKQIKKDIENRAEVTKQVLTDESFFLYIYNRPLNRILNSLVYLNYPTKEELIDWWVGNYPKSEEANLVQHQKDLFKDLEKTKFNITMGYIKAGKLLELTTILI